MEYRQIGARIRVAREAAGLSQRELGSQLGVTDSAVTHWEKGTNGVGIVELKRIARILHRPIDYFTEGVDLSKFPGQQLRLAVMEQIDTMARDGQIPPRAVGWIKEVVDKALDRLESGEGRRQVSNL